MCSRGADCVASPAMGGVSLVALWLFGHASLGGMEGKQVGVLHGCAGFA